MFKEDEKLLDMKNMLEHKCSNLESKIEIDKRVMKEILDKSYEYSDTQLDSVSRALIRDKEALQSFCLAMEIVEETIGIELHIPYRHFQ